MTKQMHVAIVAIALLGCDSTNTNPSFDVTTEGDVEDEEVSLDVVEEDVVEEELPDPGPLGWIGSPCDSVADCDYADATCIEEFPQGMCSLECDLYCPDQDGFPTTFCVDEGAVPPEAPAFTEGGCFARCDYGWFPETGCRPGYGCSIRPRANELSTEHSVCVPGEGDPLTECLEQLAALGVSFSPSSHTPESPDTHPSLTCTVDDAVILNSPVHGVEIRSYYSDAISNPYMACLAAIALVHTIDDVATQGVTAIYHMGTYNCRVIAGTDTLSRHAYGDAIDLGGFEFGDGTYYTLVDDWEHDTTTFATPGGEFLYAAAHRWYDAWIWNTILTPNYNSDHDDHFHVDLTPERHFLEYIPCPECGGRYIGPAPYDD
jgi:hypothetical protein